MSAPRRGEIWSVDLDPTKGREQSGRRPALVVSVDQLNASAAELVVVVPMTTRNKSIRSHVRVDPDETGLRSVSWIKCEDVRSISKRRLGRRIGRCGEPTMRRVGDALRILLGV